MIIWTWIHDTCVLKFEYFIYVLVPVQNVTIVEAVRSTELGNSFVLPAVTEGSSLTATCIAVGGKLLF